jgi:hypothetical protein
MMPFAVLAWCVGWSLYWVGEAKEKLKPKLSNQIEKLAIATLLPHPKLKLTNRDYSIEAPRKIGSSRPNAREERVIQS